MTRHQNLLLVLLLLATAACSSMPSGKTGHLYIKTRDWINPAFRDIHARVSVEQVDQQLYSLQYAFAVPLDPVHGVNPTEFHFFTHCLASKLAQQNRYSHWSLGAADRNLKYQNTTKLELFVATVGEKDVLPSHAKGTPVQWLLSPVASDSVYDSCSRLLRPELMWPRNQ
jgi:hypothetical protein